MFSSNPNNNMNMMMGSYALPQPVTVTQPKKQKEPVCISIPLDLYLAIRFLCVRLALDGNEGNKLNQYDRPVLHNFTHSGRQFSVVYYTIGCLKRFLSYLANQPLWSDSVTVQKKTVAKNIHSNTGSTTSMNVRCIKIPTAEIIRDASRGDANYERTMQACAVALYKYIINPGKMQERLFQPHEVVGVIADSKRVTSPSNLTDKQRLISCGYSSRPLGDQIDNFTMFIRFEEERVKYVDQSANAKSIIPDSLISKLEGKQAEIYNSQIDAEMVRRLDLSSGALLTQQQQEDMMNQKMIGNTVNVAAIALQDFANSVKQNKVTKSTSKKYTEVLKLYEQLTGTLLVAKDEKAAKTIGKRERDISYMLNVRGSKPYARFRHNPASDMCEEIVLQQTLGYPSNIQNQGGYMQQDNPFHNVNMMQHNVPQFQQISSFTNNTSAVNPPHHQPQHAPAKPNKDLLSNTQGSITQITLPGVSQAMKSGTEQSNMAFGAPNIKPIMPLTQGLSVTPSTFQNNSTQPFNTAKAFVPQTTAFYVPTDALQAMSIDGKKDAPNTTYQSQPVGNDNVTNSEQEALANGLDDEEDVDDNEAVGTQSNNAQHDDVVIRDEAEDSDADDIDADDIAN